MNDIGEVMANSIVEFFAQEQTKDLLKRLEDAGINTKAIEEETTDNRFDGKIFVLTGSLENYTRKEAGDLIENLVEKHQVPFQKNKLCFSRRRCRK